MQSNESEDLELAAFRFVAGEMNADEAATFEQLLADDQLAREAVCRTVAVSERITLAGQHPVEQGRQQAERAKNSRSRVGQVAAALTWMAVGAIVATTVLFLGGWTPQSRNPRLVEEMEPRRSNASDAPDASIDPLLIDGLVWSQIDATTQWGNELNWTKDFPRVDPPFPHFDLPAFPQHSLLDHHHQPGETE